MLAEQATRLKYTHHTCIHNDNIENLDEIVRKVKVIIASKDTASKKWRHLPTEILSSVRTVHVSCTSQYWLTTCWISYANVTPVFITNTCHNDSPEQPDGVMGRPLAHVSHLSPVTPCRHLHAPVIWSQSSRIAPYRLHLHAAHVHHNHQPYVNNHCIISLESLLAAL